MRQRHLFARIPVACLLAGLTIATNARATYVVVDDDLYPTSVVEERDRLVEPLKAESFRVGFLKGNSQVGPITRSFIDSLLPRMLNASRVSIVGRVDGAKPADNEKQLALALARASAVRNYLTKSGVPARIIQIEADTTGNGSASSGVSLADIQITSRPDPRAALVAQARTQVRAPQESAIPHAYRYVGMDAAQRPGAAPAEMPPQPGSTSDARLLQYINQAVLAGQMSPAVALQLLRGIADSNGASASTSPPLQAPIAPLAPAIPAPQERWVLDARRTLKENVDEWSRVSGWRPSIWQASNAFQVTSSVTLDGAFPDVLKRVADSTGLNICALPREKVVRVTDSNVSCNK